MIDYSDKIEKNILWGLKDEIEILDLLLPIADNSSLNPVIRYSNYFENYNSQIRSLSNKFRQGSKLPFLAFYVDDQVDDVTDCEKRVPLVFQVTYSLNQLSDCNIAIDNGDKFKTKIVKALTELMADDNRNLFRKMYNSMYDNGAKLWEWNMKAYSIKNRVSRIEPADSEEIYMFEIIIDLEISNCCCD